MIETRLDKINTLSLQYTLAELREATKAGVELVRTTTSCRNYRNNLKPRSFSLHDTNYYKIEEIAEKEGINKDEALSRLITAYIRQYHSSKEANSYLKQLESERLFNVQEKLKQTK